MKSLIFRLLMSPSCSPGIRGFLIITVCVNLKSSITQPSLCSLLKSMSSTLGFFVAEFARIQYLSVKLSGLKLFADTWSATSIACSSLPSGLAGSEISSFSVSAELC